MFRSRRNDRKHGSASLSGPGRQRRAKRRIKIGGSIALLNDSEFVREENFVWKFRQPRILNPIPLEGFLETLNDGWAELSRGLFAERMINLTFPALALATYFKSYTIFYIIGRSNGVFIDDDDFPRPIESRCQKRAQFTSRRRDRTNRSKAEYVPILAKEYAELTRNASGMV